MMSLTWNTDQVSSSYGNGSCPKVLHRRGLNLLNRIQWGICCEDLVWIHTHTTFRRLVQWQNKRFIPSMSVVQFHHLLLGINLPKHSLDFFIMSTKLIALAAELVDTNPAAAQLIANLDKADTSVEIVEALDAYDAAVAVVNTVEPTLDPIAF